MLDSVTCVREGCQNGDYSTMQYQLTGFYNRKGMCLLRAEHITFKFKAGQFPLTAESRLRSRASWCQICDGHTDTKTGVSPSSFPCQCHSTSKHLHLCTALTTRPKGRSLKTFQNHCFFVYHGALDREVLWHCFICPPIRYRFHVQMTRSQPSVCISNETITGGVCIPFK
jgi:hypothetical protein